MSSFVSVLLEPELLYLYNFSDGKIHKNYAYLTKIMLIAAKKCITRKWGEFEGPTKDQQISTVEDILLTERVTYRLRLQEAQMDKKSGNITFLQDCCVIFYFFVPFFMLCICLKRSIRQLILMLLTVLKKKTASSEFKGKI